MSRRQTISLITPPPDIPKVRRKAISLPAASSSAEAVEAAKAKAASRRRSSQALLCRQIASLHKEMQAALGRREMLETTLGRHDEELRIVEEDMDKLDLQGRRVHGDLIKLMKRQCSDEARIGDLSREVGQVSLVF